MRERPYIASEWPGPLFLRVDQPSGNALSSGISGEAPAAIYGSDPAAFGRQTFGAWTSAEQPDAPVQNAGVLSYLKTAGIGVVVGIIILAIGLYVIVRE